MFDALFGWLGSLVSGLRKLLSHIFDYIKRTVLPFILAKVRLIEAWLNSHLAPLVRFIRKVRGWYFAHIFPIQHAILEVLSRIRAALAIFRALGFKWAAKLDSDLQALQTWVTKSILAVVRPLNTALDFLDLIVSPGMVMRWDFFNGTLFSNLGLLKRAVGYGANGPESATQQQHEADDGQLLNPAQPFAQFDASGNVVLTDQFSGIVANQRAAMPDYLGGRQ